MPKRTIIEWHCARCGDEAAIEDGRAHGWRIVAGLQGYRGNPMEDPRKQPPASGDVCPACAASFLTWWAEPRQTVPTKADA
jgi:hypothetical protein